MNKEVILTDLNLVQKEAVKYLGGPMLVLSGPGSGKTRLIAHRIAYLISKGVEPSQILALTFTNKAAGEMKERVKNLLSHQPLTPPWMGTFHSICAKILRLDGHYLGIDINFSIFDDGDQLSLIKEVMKDLNLSSKNFSAGAIQNSIESAKNELLNPVEYSKYVRGYFQETVSKVYFAYQEALRKSNGLDFEDLIFSAVSLFKNLPSILEQYQNRFEHILVDEYQDTNHAQYEFSKLLASKNKNICIVGDAAQAIYGFRGADFRNVINFQQDFPETKVFNLDQNYRSTKKIIQAAREVISKNKTHPILNLWTDNAQGNPIVLYEAKNELDEADFVLRMIGKMHLKEKLPLSSFAVLYRTNAQSRVLEEAFLKEGLSYILVGGVRFYERKEVKDCLSYLRLIVNPNDSISLKRIVNVPPRGIGPVALKESFHPKVSEFFSLIENLRDEIETLKTIDALDLILKKINYLEYLDDRTQEGATRIENVKELRSVAEQFPNLTDFLENVSLVEKEPLPSKLSSYFDGEANHAVTLMTAHAAKGLEFDNVFMVGLEEGLFPHSRSMIDISELEEERRLFYVGLTRAKTNLFLTYSLNRLYFGTRGQGVASRFITDIPEELLIPIRF